MDVRVIFDSSSGNNIESWLELYKPSEISADEISWIQVITPLCENNKPDVEGLIESWEAFQLSGRPINKQTVSELAKMHNAFSGKWMFFVETGPKVDILWEKVATALVSGAMNPAMSAKVSPFNIHKDGTHVILVYNQDFTNIDEIYTLENVIRKVGIKTKMCYKPDAYTYMDIYSKNHWGLRPILYESDFDILYGGSKITEI